MAKRNAANDEPSRPRPGRPRDKGADEAILRATLALTGEVGVSGMTISAVAERAAVSTATIYRRWPTKAGLVLAALSALQEFPPEPDTGSVRQDLKEYQENFVRLLTGPGGDWVSHMMAEANKDEELRVALTSFVARRRTVLHAVLERGVARGELRSDIDLDLAQELFSGPVFFRATMADLPLSGDIQGDLIDLALGGLSSLRDRETDAATVAGSTDTADS